MMERFRELFHWSRRPDTMTAEDMGSRRDRENRAEIRSVRRKRKLWRWTVRDRR
jgi:hypothetical protein